MNSSRKLLPAVALPLACIMLSPWVAAQDDTSRVAPTAFLGSPRTTVQNFFEAMVAVNAGNDERLSEAIDCLYLDEELTREERLNEGAVIADQLFTLLDQLSLKLSEIPETVEGDDFTLILGKDEANVSLRLHRYDDERWRFASDAVDPARLKTLVAALNPDETTATPVTEPESAAPREFASPRWTMNFFLNEMNKGETENAARALDLSEIPAAARAELAGEYAFMLKGAMDRIERVDMTQIPDTTDGRPFVWRKDDVGDITIVPIEDEEGQRTWKFSAATVASLEDLWDKYSTLNLAAGLENVASEKELPWRLWLRRELQRLNMPFIFNKPLYIENWQWLGLFIVVLAGMLISRLIGFVLTIVVRRFFRRASMLINAKHESRFVLPIRISLMAWFWLLGLSLLGLPAEVFDWLRAAALVVTAAGLIWASYRLIDIIGDYLGNLAQRSAHRYDDLLVPIITRSLKIFVVVLGIVIVVNKLQGDATEILAGLGLGGLAFALAAKDVVANIFGSMTILVDRPFELGDWITVGDIDGSVESVGIRSTRIRTFYNSLISVPNSELTNSAIDNMGKRRYRRIKTTLSIAYDTPPEKIEAFCEGIRELIRKHPYTRKDYYHVYLNAFSASSLDVLLYAFVETPEWGTELREKHRLFLDVIRLANALGVEFAFPTQTLFMRQDETPTHDASPGKGNNALQQGRDRASEIVREHLGDEGAIPPPVSFGLVTDQKGEDGE